MARSGLLFDIVYVAQGVDHAGSIVGKSPRLDVDPAIEFTGPDGRSDARDRRSVGAGLHRYPDDTPQRYASVNLAGSAFIYIIMLGAAYQVTDRLRIGATVSDGAGHPD